MELVSWLLLLEIEAPSGIVRSQDFDLKVLMAPQILESLLPNSLHVHFLRSRKKS
jgi:hypothetical protein